MRGIYGLQNEVMEKKIWIPNSFKKTFPEGCPVLFSIIVQTSLLGHKYIHTVFKVQRQVALWSLDRRQQRVFSKESSKKIQENNILL